MVAHFINICTHTACCMVIYFMFGMNNVSFLTAILFSLNPVNIQGSVWISGRNYVTSSILAMGMFIFPSVSWLFYMATSHFAVNAWLSPLTFLGTKHWYMVGIIPVVWLLTTNNRGTLNRKLWETGGLKTTNTEMRAMKPKKLIPFLKTYYYYFLLSVIPYNLGVEHNFLRGFGTNKTDNDKGYKLDKYFVFGLILAILVGTGSILGIIRGWGALDCDFMAWGSILYGLFWFSVNIAIWCNFITIQQQVAERYVYLANIGMMFALANVIIHWPMVIAIFITAYFIRLWYMMDMYLNDYWAVEYSVQEIKNMHYMWLMRGVKKYCAKDHMGALYDFNEAYVHKPYDLKVLYNLATSTLIFGDVVKARDLLEKAKANVYDELGDSVKPAFDSLETMIKFVEEERAKGNTNIQIDLAKLMVVKTLPFIFLYGILNYIGGFYG